MEQQFVVITPYSHEIREHPMEPQKDFRQKALFPHHLTVDLA